jgi:hypothetical protein
MCFWTVSIVVDSKKLGYHDVSETGSVSVLRCIKLGGGRLKGKKVKMEWCCVCSGFCSCCCVFVLPSPWCAVVCLGFWWSSYVFCCHCVVSFRGCAFWVASSIKVFKLRTWNSDNHTVGISQVLQVLVICRSWRLLFFFYESPKLPYLPMIKTKAVCDFI